MYEAINQPVVVAAIFEPQKEGGQGSGNPENLKAVKPLAFRWQNKRYAVEQVNLTHREGAGESARIFFAVTAAGAQWLLSFSPKTLEWRLEELWVE